MKIWIDSFLRACWTYLYEETPGSYEALILFILALILSSNSNNLMKLNTEIQGINIDKISDDLGYS